MATARATVMLGHAGAVAIAVDGAATDLTLAVAAYTPTAAPPAAKFSSGPIHGAGFMTVMAETRIIRAGATQVLAALRG